MGMINLDLRPEIIAACELKLMHIADDRYHESTPQFENEKAYARLSKGLVCDHQSSADIRDFFNIKAQNFVYPRKSSLLATIVLFRKDPA